MSPAEPIDLRSIGLYILTKIVSQTMTFLSKILFDGSRAVAVKYLSRNVEHDVYARREIIVSSGGIESPKLLLLSGVGPRQHLEQLEVSRGPRSILG